MRSHPITLTLFVAALCASFLHAAVPQPPRIEFSDSLSSRLEEGVDLRRLYQYLSLEPRKSGAIRLQTVAQWKTEMVQSSLRRTRHDVRWQNVLARRVSRKVNLWTSATGEHYADLPDHSTTSAGRYQSSLIRMGAGPEFRWNNYLKSSHALGVVNDRRDELNQWGAATWNTALLDYAPQSETLHHAALAGNWESPDDRVNADADFDYGWDQGLESSTNQAKFGVNYYRREIPIGLSSKSQLREEYRLRVSDAVHYGLATNTHLNAEGSLNRNDTRIEEPGGEASSLEEDLAGLSLSLDSKWKRHSGEIAAAARSVSQTIRGEILQGRKTELRARSESVLGERTTLSVNAAFAKYTLDTRSEENDDDRDEISWRGDAGFSHQFSPALSGQFTVLTDLHHLVYLDSSKSANNRWTRLFQITSRFVHRASNCFAHYPRMMLSANYQAYDFDTNPRLVRSTSFRRLGIADSASVTIRDYWSVSGGAEGARENLGRLYWDEFEEERSDEINVFTASLLVGRRLRDAGLVSAGVTGYLREGNRFDQSSSGATRFHSLRSFGPLARIQAAAKKWFATGHAHYIKQWEMGRSERWILSGSLTVGRTW
ncbi:hypothetical protein IT157_06260 [bacterium]|nr:hypothetical protein [bacterium]